MALVIPLSEHLAPDCVSRLERAATERFHEAKTLREQRRWLGSLYLCGYSVECALAAAYFRRAGFPPLAIISRDIRRLRMARARQLRLMSDDPHPLVGWARFLEWHCHQSGPPKEREAQRLKESVRRAEQVYNHWRPELRYKVTDVASAQLQEAFTAAAWFQNEAKKL